ncbi:MAG: hypothetical protein RLW62_19800, partial [Gammaproteobacteria bacterium]
MSPPLTNAHRNTDGCLRDVVRCQWRRLLALRPLPRLDAGPARRFVIFGDGRTGSTLLVRLLGSHPDIHCDDEILHGWCAFPAHRVRDHLARTSAAAYGFKLLTYQLTDVMCLPWDHARALLDWLEGAGFIIIHITRENALEHALSQIGARQRGFHRVRGDRRERDRIVVTRAELFWWLEQIETRRRDNAALLAGRDVVALEYGSDLLHAAAWPATMARICAALNLAAAPPHADLE